MTARIISQFACCLESGATGAAVESLLTPIQIRMAVPTDIAALHALIEASVRGLMPQGYTSDQLEGALGTLLVIGQDVKMSFLIRKKMRPRSAPSSSIQNGLDAESAARFLRSVSMPPWPQDSRDSRWARRLPGFRCIKPEATSRSSALKCRLRTARRFLSCVWLRQLVEADFAFIRLPKPRVS